MIKNKLTRKKVFVGMSGGVDSSVSALLLKKKGFDVTGVFIKAWHPDFIPCNWKQEMRDAMRVCARLETPFLMLDLEKEYKKHVVDYLVSEYKKGRTPNPDILCNKHIKFGSFLKWSIKQGADFVATGHYAQKNTTLKKAKDETKDQTYFLWTLKPEQLEFIEFPIGHLLKSEVREIAKSNKLHISNKKDSQGICFLGQVDMKNFLKRYIKTKPGDVVDLRDNVIGRHQGVELYTIGERHGFSILNQKEFTKPHYVIKKDFKKNKLIVSDIEQKEKFTTKITMESVNLILNQAEKSKLEKTGIQTNVRIRHRGDLHNATLYKTKKENYYIKFKIPIKNVAEGQSVVFYKAQKCFGGGIVSI